jgi:hypothetical protein
VPMNVKEPVSGMVHLLAVCRQRYPGRGGESPYPGGHGSVMDRDAGRWREWR